MRIGIDIDGTLTNIVDNVIAYGQEYELENNLDEGLANPNSDFIQTAFEWGTEIGSKFWKENLLKIHQVNPRPLTKKYLDKLRDEGNEIFIITARTDEEFGDAKKLSEQWLKSHKIPFDKIIANAENKGKVCAENKIDVFVDDLPKNLDSVADQGIKSFAMNSLSSEGYNREGVTRIYSFVDLYRRLKLMSEVPGAPKTYVMSLKKKFFKKIKNGIKTIELRLRDIRRQKIKENDIINFREEGNPNRNLFRKISKIAHYKDFVELLEKEGKENCGFEDKTIEQANLIMHKFYTEDEIKKYGVIAIRFEKI